MCTKFDFFATVLTIFGVAFCIGCAIGFPLYFSGYAQREAQNKDLTLTNCTVLAHNIVNGSETYQCNCTGSTRYRNLACEQCTRNGFHLYYIVQVAAIDLLRKPFNATLEYGALNYKDDLATVKTILQLNEPIGNEYICYYDKNKPNDVQTELHYDYDFYVGGVFFLTLAAVSVLAIIVFSLACWKSIDCGASLEADQKIESKEEKSTQKIAQQSGTSFADDSKVFNENRNNIAMKKLADQRRKKRARPNSDGAIVQINRDGQFDTELRFAHVEKLHVNV